jgi:L-fucose mutarotase
MKCSDVRTSRENFDRGRQLSASTKKGPNAEVVCLNLSPGIVTCAQALRAVLSAIPIDVVNTMGIPADDPYAKFGEPKAWAEYRQIVKEAGLNVELQPVLKWDFYAAWNQRTTC